METRLRSQRYNHVLCQAIRIGGIFLTLMTVIRFIYYFINSRSFEIIDKIVIWKAFFIGFRFDLLVVGFIFIPIVLMGTLWFVFGGSETLFIKILKLYFSVTWLLILASSAISLPHYMKEGRHFRWADPIYSLKLDSTTFVLLALIFFFMMATVLKTLWKHFEDPYPQILIDLKIPGKSEVVIRFIVPILALILASRGSFGPQHLGKEDAQISPWESVNELSVNSVWCINK